MGTVDKIHFYEFCVFPQVCGSCHTLTLYQYAFQELKAAGIQLSIDLNYFCMKSGPLNQGLQTKEVRNTLEV